MTKNTIGAAAAALLCGTAATTAVAGTIEADLRAALDAAGPGETVSALLHLRDRADLRGLEAELDGLRARRRAEAAEPPPHHHEDFVAEEVPVEAGVSEAALQERLTALGALRVKGFVETDEGVMVVQGVGRRMEIVPAETTPPREMLGRVVVIRRT